MNQPEPLYDSETGEETGTFGLVDEDGTTIEIAADGTVLDAWIATGEPLDFAGAGFDTSSFAWDWDTGRLTHNPTPDERLAMLEARDAERDAAAQLEVRPAPPDLETEFAGMAYESEMLEAEGARLLPSDRRKLYAEAQRMRAVGGSGSIWDAASNLAWRGEWSQPDMNNTQDRHEWMARALQDNERVERSERHGDDDLSQELEPHRGQTEFDADDDQQRQRYMALRAQGHDGIELVTYDRSGGDTGGDELEFSEPGWAQDA